MHWQERTTETSGMEIFEVGYNTYTAWGYRSVETGEEATCKTQFTSRDRTEHSITDRYTHYRFADIMFRPAEGKKIDLVKDG
jgi:hypothetical protein